MIKNLTKNTFLVKADIDKFRMEMQEKINVFLNDLRESGEINMFGAAPYIAEVFGVNKQEARQYLQNWMENFGEDKS